MPGPRVTEIKSGSCFVKIPSLLPLPLFPLMLIVMVFWFDGLIDEADGDLASGRNLTALATNFAKFV